MKRAITALMFATLMYPAGARAGGSPAWTSRAERIVARIHVAPRGGVSAQEGTGFFVGLKDQIAYLVTAGHVIWPNSLPPNEHVDLQIKLHDCEADVPGVADSAKASIAVRHPAVSPAGAAPQQLSAVAGSPGASPGEDLDLALVKIYLADLPKAVRARCHDALAHLDDLPRHIVDPDADSLAENARAWLIGRSLVHQGAGATPLTFTTYSGDLLKFIEPFTPGDSGSPVFSDSGHIIGMAIMNASQTGETGEATKFSVILRTLVHEWEAPTNVAGPYSRLSFNDVKGALVAIDSAPDVELRIPHPAPLGKVSLKLRISASLEVRDTVDIGGAEMNCDVTTSHWLARHRRPAVYVTLGLVAATGAVFAAARMSRNRFDESPSASGYDQVRTLNAITIGSGLTALAALGATVAGYFLSDRTGIACHGVLR